MRFIMIFVNTLKVVNQGCKVSDYNARGYYNGMNDETRNQKF